MSRNDDLQQRKDKAIARGLGTLIPAYIARAENAELWDVEGRRYIDFGAGIAVLNTGHLHPRVQAAVQAQLDAFSHTCLMITPYENAVSLAERLNGLVPIEDAKTVFSTTGAEAVENALKLARAYTGRPGVIAFQGGYHGRTHMTMGITGKVNPYKAGFGPFPPELHHVPFPNAYHGISVDESLRALERIFQVSTTPETIGALIIEPVQGEGGFYPAPAEFLRALRAFCDRHELVFICDEIQTGFARTGRMFAIEHAGVSPDLITMAKGLAGGLPLSAVVGRAEIVDTPPPGGLGGTYAGSPVGCAAGLAVLDVIEEQDLIGCAQRIGETMMARLAGWQARYPDRLGHIRNLGAMVAMEWVRDGDPDQPDAELTRELVGGAAERGLIILPCGVRGNAIRLLAPLTIGEQVLAEGLDILDSVLAHVL